MKSEAVHHHYYYGQAAAPQGVAAPAPAAYDPAGQTAPYGAPFGAAPLPTYNPHRHPGADSLVKGLVVGAGVAYVLTNETAQRAILRSSLSLWTRLRGAFAEAKERFHDAEAEAEASLSHRREG